MAWQFNVSGDQELRRMLQSLPVKLARKALSPALRKGAKRIMAAAKRGSPVLTGMLAQGNWKVRVGKTSRRKAKVKFRVLAPTRDNLGINPQDKHYYPAVLEYGGKNQEARPFLRPAANQETAAVIAEVRAAIRDNIAKLASEAKKGGE